MSLRCKIIIYYQNLFLAWRVKVISKIEPPLESYGDLEGIWNLPSMQERIYQENHCLLKAISKKDKKISHSLKIYQEQFWLTLWTVMAKAPHSSFGISF